jgi:hypothetical protein
VETRLKQPKNPPFVEGYAKGVLSQVEHFTKAKLRTEISDDFEDGLGSWVNVQGALRILSGNINSTAFGYAAGYHRTQLLSDNCRAKVTIQDGLISSGRSCVVICADVRFQFYYGLVVETGIFNNKFHIVRGTGPKSRQVLDTVTVEVDNNDSAEIWFDQTTSTLRAYYNGSEVLAVPVDRNDIPHGPGRRYCGVVMGIDWFLSPGALFEDFEAWDVGVPGPFLQDGFDSSTVSADWDELDHGVEIHHHLFVPNTLGPHNVFWTDAAVLHTTAASQDSVKIVIRVYNIGAGKFTVALCSNDAMTNWCGVQFETGIINNAVHIVVGSGPTDYSYVGEWDWELSTNGTVFIITYNSVDDTYRLFRNTSTTPILEWPDVSNVITHGASKRRIGLIWETAILSPGVEPSMIEAYNVTADAPL